MSEQPDLQQRHRRTLGKLVLGAVAMFGFAFAMVPIYNVLCDITGLNGKTRNAAAAAPLQTDAERTVRVEFITTRSKGMPWQFEPEVHSVRVHPGEVTQVNFLAGNPTELRMVAQAIPSVSPGLAAPHLLKTQCFCFDQQVLDAGAETSMPMIFYLDPALPKHITTVTLSYTLFDITDSPQANAALALRQVASRQDSIN